MSLGHKARVAYFYDSEIGNYHYGQGHPMKVRPPARATEAGGHTASRVAPTVAGRG